MLRSSQSRYSPVPFAVAGVLTIAATFGAAGVWAAHAPLASAIVAKGSVAVRSHRKMIQHLEGGIVAEIMVRETARVSAGDVLVVLDTVQTSGNLKMLSDRMAILRATEARLAAEQLNADTVEFPEITPGQDDLVASAIDGQADIFADRRAVLQSHFAILQKRVEQVGNQIEAMNRKKAALDAQSVLMAEEIARLREGKEKGAVPVNHLAAKQREEAELLGAVGSMEAELARTAQLEAEARMEIVRIENEFRDRAGQELKDVRAEIAQIEERIAIAKDAHSRTSIRSPIDGIVQNLQVHTAGGVVRPGEPIMEIVPVDDELIIDARVRPIDIDSLQPGMEAEVRFAAFHLREMPIITGSVESLSPDVMVPENGDDPYYLARIVADENTIPDDKLELLVPGMPAEAVLPTAERTVLEYLVDPLRDAIRTGMREE